MHYLSNGHMSKTTRMMPWWMAYEWMSWWGLPRMEPNLARPLPLPRCDSPLPKLPRQRMSGPEICSTSVCENACFLCCWMLPCIKDDVEFCCRFMIPLYRICAALLVLSNLWLIWFHNIFIRYAVWGDLDARTWWYHIICMNNMCQEGYGLSD